MPEPVETQTSQTPAADTAAVEQRSDAVQEQAPPPLWERIFGKKGADPEQEAPASAQTTDAPSIAALLSKPMAELTDSELDDLVRREPRMQRRVQAETDRREAKRLQDTRAKERADRQALIERKLTPGTPEYDPYEASEERQKLKAEEQAGEQFASLLSDIGKQHDSVTLDVLIEALPEPERDRIFKIEGAGVGLEGRRLIVTETLKALEKHYRGRAEADVREKLRKDPVFRKQVLADIRGEDYEEPELLPTNGAARRGDAFMDGVFDQYRALKGHRR